MANTASLPASACVDYDKVLLFGDSITQASYDQSAGLAPFSLSLNLPICLAQIIILVIYWLSSFAFGPALVHEYVRSMAPSKKKTTYLHTYLPTYPQVMSCFCVGVLNEFYCRTRCCEQRLQWLQYISCSQSTTFNHSAPYTLQNQTDGLYSPSPPFSTLSLLSHTFLGLREGFLGDI